MADPLNLSLTINANDATAPAFKAILAALNKIQQGAAKVNNANKDIAATSNAPIWRRFATSVGGVAKEAGGLGMSLVNVGRSAVSAGMGLAGLGSLLSVAGLTKAAGDSFNFGSALLKLGDDTNVPIEELQILRKAAQDTRVSMDEVTGGLAHFREMGRNVALGKDPAMAATLKDMGLTGQDVFKETPDSFAKVVKSIEAITDAKVKYEAEDRLFGQSGRRFTEFLHSLATNYGKYEEAAGKIGIVSKAQAELLQEGQNRWQDLGDSFTSLRNSFTAQLGPGLISLTKDLTVFLQGLKKEDITAFNDVLLGFGRIMKGVLLLFRSAWDDYVGPFFTNLGDGIDAIGRKTGMEDSINRYSILADVIFGLMTLKIAKLGLSIVGIGGKLFGLKAAGAAAEAAIGGFGAAVEVAGGFAASLLTSVLALPAALLAVAAIGSAANYSNISKELEKPNPSGNRLGQMLTGEVSMLPDPEVHGDGSFANSTFGKWWNKKPGEVESPIAPLPSLYPQKGGPRANAASDAANYLLTFDFKNVLPGLQVDVAPVGPGPRVAKTRVGYGQSNPIANY